MTDPISADNSSNPLTPEKAALALPFSTWMRGFSRSQRITDLFELADVAIGGSRPWDIRVHRDRFYRRLLAGGSLALGDSYMDGDWDCEALDQFFDRVISNRLGAALGMNLSLALLIMVSRLQNRQTISRARHAADIHYDLPVDIFEATFDQRLTGSCYWASAATLDDAQEAKLAGLPQNRPETGHCPDIGWDGDLPSAMRRALSRNVLHCFTVQVDYTKKRYAGLAAYPLLDIYRKHGAQGRPPRLDGHFRTCGFEELSDIFRVRAPLYEKRWPVSSANDMGK
jgi:hypothetical protein